MTRPNINAAALALHDGYNDRIISKEMRDLLVRVVEGLGKEEEDPLRGMTMDQKSAFVLQNGFKGGSEKETSSNALTGLMGEISKSLQETPKEGRNPYKCSDCGMALLSPRPALDLDALKEALDRAESDSHYYDDHVALSCLKVAVANLLRQNGRIK